MQIKLYAKLSETLGRFPAVECPRPFSESYTVQVCLHWSPNLSQCDLDKVNLDSIYTKPVSTAANSNCFLNSQRGTCCF